MNLSPRRADALTEVINIAFGRTASALSELTGKRALVEAPDVGILQLAELADTLGRCLPGQVASVHQNFSGPIMGDALLLLSHSGAAALTGLLTDGTAGVEPLDESSREVLTEVGNILLNACLGMFGNLLGVRVSFSVPRLVLDSAHDLVGSLIQGSNGPRHALVVSMAFRVRTSSVTGYLALVLGVASLDQLIAHVDSWEDKGIAKEPPGRHSS
jgi:chemotaxis protein CheC